MKKILYLMTILGLFFLIPSSAFAAQIPADAKIFNGHAYYMYDVGTTMEDAIEFCESVGGHLATLNSPEENQFVYDNVGDKYVLFGLTDEGSPGIWHWYNGEPTNYLNWAGFPSSSDDWACFDTYHSATNQAKWLSCNRWVDGAYHNFICEWGEVPENFQPSSPSQSSNPTPSQPSTPSNGVNVYRVYTPVNGEHMFTTDYYEVQVLTGRGWSYEGVAWVAPTAGSPVYRLYSPVTTAHLYTSDPNEVSTLQGQGWSVDNNFTPMFYSGGSGNVYRLYNPGLRQHMLTTNYDEYNQLGRNGWNQEGTGFKCQ